MLKLALVSQIEGTPYKVTGDMGGRWGHIVDRKDYRLASPREHLKIKYADVTQKRSDVMLNSDSIYTVDSPSHHFDPVSSPVLRLNCELIVELLV